MALITQIKNFTVPNPDEFPRLEKDAMIVRGSKALFDFSGPVTNPSQSNTLQPGAPLFNLVRDSHDAKTAREITGIIDQKGIVLSGVANSGAQVYLPIEDMNIASWVVGKSFALYTWITPAADLLQGTDSGASHDTALLGCAYQNSIYHQWSLATTLYNQTWRFQLGRNNKHEMPLTTDMLGKPALITMYCKRASSENFTGEYYFNEDLKNATGLSTYTFPESDNEGNPLRPLIGQISGFATTFKGVVHRVHLAEVDETSFDIAGAVAEEYRRNIGRFA